MVLFLVFFLFIDSDALLFISFFWASLLSSNAAVSLGGAFISLEISSSFLIFFSLFSFILACKSKNFGSWVYRLMIRFIVLSSFFLQDYISFIFSLVFFFYVFSFGVVVFLSKFINL